MRAFILALVAIIATATIAAAATAGVRVVTADEFDAYKTATDARLDALEKPAPTPTPTVTPTPTPTPTPTVTPTPSPTQTTTTATPSPTPTTTPPAGEFPNAANTGDPSTADNTAYTGPATVSASGTVIENKRIAGALNITGSNVVIRNSTITGNVFFQANQTGGRIEDSTVINTGNNGAGVNYYNYTALRVEVTGGRQSMSCAENCTVIDSWLHGQEIRTDWHSNGFSSNGGDRMTLRHNTLACDAPQGTRAACSAALSLYGDFDPITNVIVDNNLFKSSPASYCMYGGYDTAKPYGARSTNIDVTNNVFERGSNGKCAVYGPVANAAYDSASSWSGNRWSDGTVLNR